MCIYIKSPSLKNKQEIVLICECANISGKNPNRCERKWMTCAPKNLKAQNLREQPRKRSKRFEFLEKPVCLEEGFRVVLSFVKKVCVCSNEQFPSYITFALGHKSKINYGTTLGSNQINQNHLLNYSAFTTKQFRIYPWFWVITN